METWRLSRIEDELDKLDFSQEPSESLSSSIFNSLAGDLGITFSNVSQEDNKLAASGSSKEARGVLEKIDDMASKVDEGYSEEEFEQQDPDFLPPPPDELLYGEEEAPSPDPGPPPLYLKPPNLTMESSSFKLPYGTDMILHGYKKKVDTVSGDFSPPADVQSEEKIYSEAVVRKKSLSDEDQQKLEKDGVKHITDKYNSLNRMKLNAFGSYVPPGYVSTRKGSSINKSSEDILSDIAAKTTLEDNANLNIEPTRRKSTENILSQIPVTSPNNASLFFKRDRKQSWSNKFEQDSKDGDSSSNALTSNQLKRTIALKDSLSEQEILQVDMFYRSRTTQVFVCQCLVELHFGSVKNSKTFDNFYSDRNNSSGWTSMKSGIPALVLDEHFMTLQILIAERGTGFTLWKELMSHATNYTVVQPNFHTLHIAKDPSKLVGLSFQESSSAADFFQKYKSIISNEDYDILNMGKKKGKAKKKEKKKSKKPPRKADISAPCCFTHITALDQSDGLQMASKS